MFRDRYVKTRAVVALVRAQELPFMTAALAYYAFLSVVPLLIVALTAATAVAGQAVATRVLASVGDLLTPEAATIVEETIVDAPGRNEVTVAGLAVLLWGALRMFRGLDLAFSRVYGTATDKSLPAQVRDALLVLAAIALAVAATAVAGTLLARAPVPLAVLGGPLGLLIVLPPVFFPLYYVFPARDVGVREAVPGTVFAAAGWAALGTLFGIYAARAGSFELYGVLGGVLLLLVWFYFGGLLLLVGAALNAVGAGRFRDRQLQHGGPRGNSQRATMSDSDGPTDDHEAGDEQAAPGSGDDPADTPDGGGHESGRDAESDPETAPAVTREEIESLRERLDEFEDQLDEDTVEHDELDEFEEEIDERTVHRDEIETDLRRYVRRRVRRGHARGWGPYLVLLYGTAMTLGAFVYLGGGWAVLAMIIIWLSTLGLYALMLIVGLTSAALGAPGRLIDRLRDLR
jgi:YihY family inner membrane protein